MSDTGKMSDTNKPCRFLPFKFRGRKVDGVHRCTLCLAFTNSDPAAGNYTCRHNPNKPVRVSFIKKIKNYVAARAKWIAAGKPTRSPQEILHLFQTYCEPCPHFVAGACELCGCPVKRKSNWRNKLAWKTEGCPLPEPKFLPSVEATVATEVIAKSSCQTAAETDTTTATNGEPKDD